MLTHHNLKVYEKALAVAASAEVLSAPWGRRHAIVDQYRRASESIVLNIAEGARLHLGPDKARTLDYAIGSTLECAACLDIAGIKGCRTPAESLTEKGSYLELDHRRFLEIAAASAVKAAAYLDLYRQKALPACVETAHGRELLSRITARLDGF